jgi:hypothetical protein
MNKCKNMHYHDARAVEIVKKWKEGLLIGHRAGFKIRDPIRAYLFAKFEGK